MRKALFIFAMLLSILSATAAPPGASHSRPKRSIMELPLFERAVLIIKKFETLHKPRHWPYVGYGHRVQPGDGYRRGVQLTEPQADALLRKDLRKFCRLYSQYGKDSVLLGTLAYNIGPAAVNKSSVLRLLKSNTPSTGAILRAYASHCRYNGKFHKQLHTRRLTEFAALYTP